MEKNSQNMSYASEKERSILDQYYSQIGVTKYKHTAQETKVDSFFLSGATKIVTEIKCRDYASTNNAIKDQFIDDYKFAELKYYQNASGFSPFFAAYYEKDSMLYLWDLSDVTESDLDFGKRVLPHKTYVDNPQFVERNVGHLGKSKASYKYKLRNTI